MTPPGFTHVTGPVDRFQKAGRARRAYHPKDRLARISIAADGQWQWADVLPHNLAVVGQVMRRLTGRQMRWHRPAVLARSKCWNFDAFGERMATIL